MFRNAILLGVVLAATFVAICSAPATCRAASPLARAPMASSSMAANWDAEPALFAQAHFAPSLFAQAAAEWPKYDFTRGSGGIVGYFAIWKVILIWIVFLLWLYTTSWINRDTQIIGKDIGLTDAVWNPVVYCAFLLGFFVAATWILPFFVGFPLYFLTWVVPLGAYVATRNGRVEQPDKVLTGAHIKKWFKGLGKKQAPQRKMMPWELGPPMNFKAAGANSAAEQANLIEARQTPAFVPAKELLADAMMKRADRVLLDYTADAVAVRYEIDGMWHNSPTRDRPTGDAMLYVFKRLAGLNHEDRRNRQEGKFRADYMNVKHDCTLTTQGVKTGERVVLMIVRPTAKIKTLEQAGMREAMRERFKELIEARSGLILVAAPPGGGLSTTWNVTIRAKDRYVKECITVENAAAREEEVENVTVNTYNLAAGETPDKILPAILLRQPDVLFVPDLVNGATVDILCQQVLEEDRTVIGRIPAKDAADALIRALALKPDKARFSKAVIAVLAQRLVRKLCDACKQADERSPQLMPRLGIPPGRVPTLYREYRPPPPEQLVDNKGRPIAPPICGQCGGIGYYGRTAVFELLMVSDRMRQALMQDADANALRQLAAQEQPKHSGLQEEGVLLVAQGATSIDELKRVLQQ